MTMTTMTAAPAHVPRFAVVDLVRGLAIVGVVIYHFAWDLSYFQFISADVATGTLWRSFARLLAGTFLALVGVSLVLAHRRGMRWRAFFRRLGVIALCAGGISLATWLVFPQAFVFFGILHAIALFSVLALPFLRLPVWLTALVALLVLLLPLWVEVLAFESRWLAWIGLVPNVPPTNDYEPVFPWFGITLSGIVVARLALASGLAERARAWRPSTGLLRWIETLGRWTLVIYLVHQPILFAILTPIAWAFPPDAGTQRDSFLASCQSNCEQFRGAPDLCGSVCACSAAELDEQDLWALLREPQLTLEERTRLAGISQQCYAEVQIDRSGSDFDTSSD